MLQDYHLTGELTGEGPYKLHRARRRADALPVLIKVPRHEPARQSDVAGLELEFKLLDPLPRECTRLIALERRNGRGALVFQDAGGVLLSTLCESAPPDLGASLAIATHLAAALAELHRRNIIHGGINPQGILVDPHSWQAHLIDFSSARRAMAEQGAAALPDLPSSRLMYVSPEQTGRMNRAVDYRADFYALGVCLYQMLTGASPFRADDPLELVHAHIAKMPAAPSVIDPSIPPVLDQLVLKLLAKTADERYQSALGLRADLEYCANEWARQRHIPQFALAAQDISDRFNVPQRLYGREAQLAELLRAFEQTCQGRSALLLVAGYSGIGKTTLIRELYKPLVRSRGYFVSGKFEQLERDNPYRALLHAFRQLIKRLLAEGETRLAVWRERLVTALGANAGVLAEVLPEIELIIGPQSPAPPLEPAQAQNRFRMVLQKFLGVLARREHPLIVFLDDLQWVDAATLRLLQPLLTSPEIGSLLLIGAYRDNEVGSDHPLAMTLAELLKAGIPPQAINLAPLSLTDLTQFVGDSLKREPADAQPLAELLQRKTDGNPFFVIQFLKTLHQEGLIAFDYARGRWAYDMTAIANAPITGNVIDLMSRKIRRLAPATQRAVILAGAVGSRFNLGTLAIVSEQTRETTRSDLQQALDEGLILAMDEEAANPAYSFLHDRVQQAAYALNPGAERPALHLRIGRLLLQQRAGAGVEDQVFEIARHLNTGAALIDDDIERLALVDLNLTAGRRAKSSAAWAAALGYLRAGVDLLADDRWRAHYDLSFALEIEAAECEYLCGRFDVAERHFDALLAQARSPLDKARVYDLRVVQYENMSRYADAARVGAEGVALLGISFPENSDAQQVALEAEIQAIERLRSGRSIESLVQLPVMDEAENRMAMRLLTDMWAPAYISREGVPASLISARMVCLSIQYGNTADSAYGYVTHAITVGPSRGDYRSAYEWGTLALAVNERFEDRKGRAKIHQQFNAHVTLWRKPLHSCVIHAREACRAGLENGDFAYAGYGAFTESWPAFVLSRDLDRFVRDLEPNLELLLRIRTTGLAAAHSVILNWARALLGRTDGPRSLSSGDFQETAFIRLHGDNPFFMTVYSVAKLHLAVLLEDQAGALEAAHRAQRIGWGHGTIWPVLLRFWRGLALTGVYEKSTAETQSAYWQELVATKDALEVLAENCPENYRCFFLVISAELARIRGDAAPALDLLEEAIHYARQTENLQQEALAQELSGRLWLQRGNDTAAEVYLGAARHLYGGWGAVTKVRQLEAQYLQLRLIGRERNAPSLDTESVTKAARAIASEIEQNRLMATLMRIAIENAGAERACLILERDGEAFVCAEGSVDTPPSEDSYVAVPLDAAARLPTKIINYVRRTAQSLVIADARRDDRYAEDRYVVHDQPRSVLCVPVLNQGRLTGVLYLENTLIADVFTQERIEIMRILAAQAAISLHNARLYDERRRAETALRDSEAKYQDLYDNAPDMFVSVNADAKIIRCNLTFAQAMGYTREEILGRPIFDMYHPDCLPQVHRNFTTFLQTGDVRNSELQLRRKDGSTLEVMLNSSAVRDENGKVLYSRSVWRDITELKRAETALKQALSEVEQLKNRLQAENVYLQEEIKLTHNFEEMVGGSPALRAVLRNIEVVAPTDATVLIMGETGVGKELIARAVHDRSQRRERTLVKVNCAAISAGLVESELFGHVKGAFTGALANRTGRFELAHGGTIFLDEIGDLAPETQVKLLRVLQEREFEPVGSSRTVRVDARVIAATNRDLEKAVQEGRFRADLYYRLNVFPVMVPPLRERREDIPQLVMYFLTRFAKKFGKRLDRVSRDTMETLVNHDWPGNVRDLQNVIERAAILSQGNTLRLGWDLPPVPSNSSAAMAGSASLPPDTSGAITAQRDEAPAPSTLEELERRHITAILRQTGGVIEGAKGAACVLNLRPSTLRARMKKLGISRSSHASP